MKRTGVIYAVTILAALSFTSLAIAMGGSMGQGNGGGSHSMGGHAQQGRMQGMQHSGNGAGSGTGSRHEAMHETMHEAGSRQGGNDGSSQQHMMNGGTASGGSDTQPAAQAPATAQPDKN